MYNLDGLTYNIESKEIQYTGQEICPSVEILSESEELELIEGTDYEIEYQDNINIGTGKIIITGKGDFEGEKIIIFKIIPMDISSDCIISCGEPDENGCYKADNIAVSCNEIEMNEETDYLIAISDKNEYEDGYYKISITVTGKNNFSGSKTSLFNVEKLPESIDINTLDINLSKTNYLYSGSVNEPEVIVLDNSGESLSTKYYKVEYQNNINAGEAQVKIIGIIRYSGEKTLIFNIDPLPLETASVICGEPDENGCYNLKNLSIAFSNGLILKEEDYETSIEKEEVDSFIESEITITGKGNYIGNIIVKFITEKIPDPIITTTDISTLDFALNQSVFTYSGTAFAPDIRVKDGDKILVKDTDYIVEYQNNINAGKGEVLVTAIGEEYHGNKIVEFIIEQLDLSSGSLNCGSADENGCYDLLNIQVVVNNIILDKNIDYTYSYTTEKDGYDIYSTVIVNGNGNYVGSITKRFKTQKITMDINDADINIQYSVYTYTGELISPKILTNLEENVDYEVTYENSINFGRYKVIVVGIGNYNGRIEFNYSIDQKTVENADILCGEPDADKCYDLNNLTVEIDGKILEQSRDYQSFAIEKEIENGYIESTVTIIGINNYKGTKTTTILTSKLLIYPGKTIELELATIYPRYGTIKSNITKSGTFYLWDNKVINNRIRITNNVNGIGKLGYITGWVDMDNLIERNDIRVGDKVIVNGKINTYADGTGNFMIKNNIAMYVVDMLDSNMFEYCYAVASDINRARQGWAKLDMLTLAKE